MMYKNFTYHVSVSGILACYSVNQDDYKLMKPLVNTKAAVLENILTMRNKVNNRFLKN